ncbi:MAG: hypothetical protein GX162_10830 [Firmicutes bacterium]|jgi:hypothetical protein|nr:hypothetical protein [Bacillota bacterium]
MAFNVDVFELTGLLLPISLARQGQWSWDQLIAVGKLIRDTDGDGIRDEFALGVPSAWQPDWYGKSRSHGGDVLRDDQVVIDAPESQCELQSFAGIGWTHQMAPLPGGSADFEMGTQAMTYVWSSEAPGLAQRIMNRFH